MKFIHTSDLHLCASLAKSALPANAAAVHRAQLWKTFRLILDACLAEQVDILFIAGDLFEGAYARISDYKRVADAFKLIPNTKVFISCGNHDFLGDESFYTAVTFPDNVFIFPSNFTKVALPALGVNVYGFSWAKNAYEKREFEFVRDNDEAFSFLCLHTDAINKNNHYMPTDPADIAKAGYDYCALGHIHKPTRIADNIHYSGSPEPLDFGETGRHGFILGELNGEKLALKFVSCAAREFINDEIEITGDMGYSEIEALIDKTAGPGEERKICRLNVKGTLNTRVDLKLIEDGLKDDYAYFELKNNALPDYDIERLLKDNDGNMIGAYINALSGKNKNDRVAAKAMYYGLEALLAESERGRSQ